MKRLTKPWSFGERQRWFRLPTETGLRLLDVIIFSFGLAIFYGVLAITGKWLGPLTPEVEISRSPWVLPIYAGYSLFRIAVAYIFSLLFTLVYGYIAANNEKAERFMVPLLDVLQSVPVLSFLPGVMLAMMALFPAHQIGLECGSILLIFTGQVWNMAFSFYASLKGIPRDMREAARVYRFSWWQRFTRVELPSAAIGLVWNSMMSVAGGWFFLMACEMFVLGKRDFRLPGLGSYLQTAASAGDTQAILWGVAAMIAVIVLLDQLVWRPVIAWAEKFKVEQVESSNRPKSWFLNVLRKSPILTLLSKKLASPAKESLTQHFARLHQSEPGSSGGRPWNTWATRTLWVLVLAIVCYGASRFAITIVGLDRREVRQLLVGTAATFFRVNVALVLGALWTIPVGVAIGFHPRLARVTQPLVQIAASVPATALFPVILVLLIGVGGGLGVGSIALLLLGTQWYILFNVIAGAMAIPTDLKEATAVLGIRGVARWRKLILPGIFPYLVTGLVTASGGAWNASIVAEYFHFRGQTIFTTGLGSIISQATDAGNLDLLLAATIAMAGIVVVINRLLWRRLYRLAELRFSLES